MKNHLKKIAAPRTWIIDRKQNTFITRPKPGAHSLVNGISLGVVLRDILQLGKAMSEIKKLLNMKEILVDGKRRKDHRYIIGLFDVLSIPLLNKAYRLSLNKRGKIVLGEIPAKESNLKLVKVVGKKIITKGKLQLNLHDGKNIIVDDKKIKVGDSLLLELPKLIVKDHFKLQPGIKIFFTGGKYKGAVGDLENITEKEVICVVAGKKTENVKSNLFVLGNKKTAIQVNFEDVKTD